jgi:Histidine kinase-, DNA gyrase B-, and HSP90-like ATPase
VIIRTERDGDGAVRARVRDFGTGLPTDVPERVFDRFFSTKREGMGIGLFIARSIVVARWHALGGECGGRRRPVLVATPGVKGDRHMTLAHVLVYVIDDDMSMRSHWKALGIG